MSISCHWWATCDECGQASILFGSHMALTEWMAATGWTLRRTLRRSNGETYYESRHLCGKCNGNEEKPESPSQPRLGTNEGGEV